MALKGLIVYYSLGGQTKKAAEAIATGMREEGIEVRLKNAPDANADDMAECDFLVFGTPDYFSYMAGGMKDFFDRCWHAKKRVAGKYYAVFVTHGDIGYAIKSMITLCHRFEFKRITRPMIIPAPLHDKEIEHLRLFGRHIAHHAHPRKTPSILSHTFNRICHFFANRIRKALVSLYRL